MARDEYITILFRKYLEGSHTPEELVHLLRYFGIDEASDQLTELIEDALSSPVSEREKTAARVRNIQDRVAERLPLSKPRSISKWLPYAAAVAIFALITLGYLFLGGPEDHSRTIAVQEIAPGTNRAVLTLANGRTINLDEAQAGIIVGTDNITYADGASLGLSPAGGGRFDNIEKLVLSTPKGGTYQVTLPDGSKVWLNSESSLTYPSRFSEKERIVELDGEAYFEIEPAFSSTGKRVTGHLPGSVHNQVASLGRLPFRVKTAGQTVEVLGTSFNISAYTDEEISSTTLVEGSVQIVNRYSNAISQLRPGQQGVVQGEAMQTRQVDVESFTSWKDGYFYFKNTPIRDVMRQLARWYNVEVVYQGQVPQETFSGRMDRDLTLNALVKLLDVSDIRARIDGNDKLILY